jgi:hypothetical protein
MRTGRRDSEGGFALLVVLLMAAFVAIALYSEVPRVLFEAQRAKEQLLVDRGNEYRRAIKVYVRKMQGRYPPSIDALVQTNDIHFLRKKFTDPMTGKDDWRLIHIAGNGIFPDSLTQAPPKSNLNASGSSSGPGSVFTASSGTDDQTQQLPEWAQRLRPSDTNPVVGGVAGSGVVGGIVPAEGEAGQYPPGQQVQPAQGAQVIGTIQPGQPQGGMQIAGSIQPANPPQGIQVIGTIQGGQPGYPQQDQGQVPGQPPYPTQNIPGLPGPYGQQAQGGMPPSGPGTMSGTGPLPPGGAGSAGPPGSSMFTPVATSFGAQNPQTAQQMIQRSLRMGGGGSGSTEFGALIAGVASKSEGEGIKTLDGRSKYKEWEFIYDMRKDMMGAAGVPARGVQPQQPNMPHIPGRD